MKLRDFLIWKGCWRAWADGGKKMYILWTMVKLCLLMASNFGYWEAARRKWNMNVYLLPAVTIGAQFCVMFAAGLLNYLGEAAELMYCGGLILLLWQLYREKGRFWKLLRPYCSWGYGLFLLGMLVSLTALRGKTLAGIDNFTHWAVVVKNLLLYDRFPTFAQEAVTFTSYPLGSAAGIYYFCRHVSDGEWAFMLGQAYMMLSMLLPLFSRGRGLAAATLVAVMGNFLLCYDIPITELLVDTLLPLTAGAMLASVALGSGETGSAIYRYSLPMLVLTLNVKNSGLFFCAVGLLLMWHLLRKQGKSLKPVLAVALVLLAVSSLWKHHCDYVFVNSRMSQHAVSMEYFQMRLGERTPEEMARILRGVVSYVLSRKPLGYLAAWLAAGLGCACLTGNGKRWGILAAVCVGLYAAWTVSLAGMYLFSMSVQEALELLSIERYCRTMDILLYYLLTAFCLSCLPEGCPKRWLAGGLVTALALTTWVGSCGVLATIAAPPQGDTALRERMEEMVAEYGVEKGYSYLICDPVAGGYAMFALRYCMNTSRVQQVAITAPEQMDIEKDYDYVFLLDTENPILEQWVLENYPEQAGRTVIQCIK